jgi:hypothetical protein
MEGGRRDQREEMVAAAAGAGLWGQLDVGCWMFLTPSAAEHPASNIQRRTSNGPEADLPGRVSRAG